MALEVLIYRTELALPTLDVTAGAYRWSTSDTESPGVSWERRRAGSPYTDGEYLVSRRKALTLQPARIIVTGADNASLRANLDTLIKAVSQFSWQIRIDPDASDPAVAAWTWNCEPADYSTGLVRLERNLLITDLALSIPRMPDPDAGSLI